MSSLDKKILKVLLRESRKASTPVARNIVKSLRAQIKRRKGKESLKGQPPIGRTGKFRKLLQSRKKFKGAGRPDYQGNVPFLKIKGWTPVSNVLFSPKSRRYRALTVARRSR